MFFLKNFGPLKSQITIGERRKDREEPDLPARRFTEAKLFFLIFNVILIAFFIAKT